MFDADPGPRSRIAVFYGGPTGHALVELALVPGETAGEAVHRSGILDRFPGLGHRPQISLDGKIIAWESLLRAGDRIDLLRPLTADPKEARRRRAEVQRRKRQQP